MDSITAHRAKTGQQQQRQLQQQLQLQLQQSQGTSQFPPHEMAAERPSCPQRGGGVQIGIGSPASQHSTRPSSNSHGHVVMSPGSENSHMRLPSEHPTMYMDMDTSSGLSISELSHHDASHAYDPMLAQQETSCDNFHFPHFPDPLPTPNTFADQLSPRASTLLDSSFLSHHELEIDPSLMGAYHYSPCYCSSISDGIGSGDAAGTATKTTRGSALPSTTPLPSTMEDRFELISESVRHAGFKSMDDMILSYYTAALDEDSDMCHEQRMSRKRGLPAILSALRISAATWDEYERQGYQAEILESAESLLVHECRELFSSSAFKHRLSHLHSPLTPHTPSSSSSLDGDGGFENPGGNTAAPHQSVFMYQTTSHLRVWLSEELPNVWKLISALSGCRAGSQPVATTLLTLCFAQRLRADDAALLLHSGST